MGTNKRTHSNAFFSDTSTSIEQKKKRRKKAKKSVSLDLSQAPLLEKINAFLIKMERKNADGSQYQISTEGYCHGLTLLFLEKMEENNVQWFYDTKRKIIESKEGQLDELELEIEKFLAMMEWAQNPHKYTNNKIKYSNIDVIMDTQPQLSFDSLYTFAQLTYFLTYKQGKGNMICLTNCYGTSREHSIGIFTDGTHYHLYDANYKHGQAVSYQSSKELTQEVLNRLYSNFDEDIPEHAELEIKIANRNPKKNTKQVVENSNAYNFFFNKTDTKENGIQSNQLLVR